MTPPRPVGCTIIGTTGVHIRAAHVSEITLNTDLKSGYVMLMPIDGHAAQLQTNMAGTLNLDWVLSLASDAANSIGVPVEKDHLLTLIDGWIADTQPAAVACITPTFPMRVNGGHSSTTQLAPASSG
jgi:erythritol kinase